jgi:hypothetical protein
LQATEHSHSINLPQRFKFSSKLPMLFMFPTNSFLDHSPGSLCTYTKCWHILLVDVRSLIWQIHQLFHFHPFPCVQAPTLIGSCYVLPVSPEIDGCLTIGKNIDSTTRVALLYILHYTSLNGIHFSLEYWGV